MVDSVEVCADKLELMASDERFLSRKDDLVSLSNALRDQSDSSWTGVDLVGAFPADATITSRPMPSVERWLGIFAGASVFLPVAWTWWSLNKAIAAYNSELFQANLERERGEEAIEQTFLSIWSNLGGIHEFGTMALVSVGLILFALACIVTHRWVADRNVTLEDEFMHGAHQELVIELLRAQRLLNERRADDPRFLEAAIKRSVNELISAQESTRQGVEALNQATLSALDQLDKVTTASVETIGDSSKQAILELNGAIKSTVTELNEMTVELRSGFGPLVDSTVAASDALVTATDSATKAHEGVSASTTDLQSSMRSLAQNISNSFDAAQRNSEKTSQELHAALKRILDEFGVNVTTTNLSLKESTQSALASLTSSVESVAAAKDQWSQALATGLAGNERAVGNVDTRLNDFVALLQSHQSALQAQVTEIARAADLSGQLLAELQNQSRR